MSPSTSTPQSPPAESGVKPVQTTQAQNLTTTQAHPENKVTTDIKETLSSIEGYLILIGLLIIAGAIQRFLIPLLQRWLSQPLHPFKHDMKIAQMLSFLLGRAGEDAIRIVMYEFHNGDITGSGRHYNRISITNEEGVPKAAPFFKEYQSAPVGIFNKSIESCFNNDLFRNEANVQDLGEHGKMLQVYGVVQVAQYLIYQDPVYYGILEIHYESDESIPVSLKEDMEEVALRIRHTMQTANASLWNAIFQQFRNTSLQQQASSLSNVNNSNIPPPSFPQK
jgi:hypothetical protein